ncbi:MAG: SDR family NAD(P)-dependent oxidoreductase, partial [Salinivirgaceae bacterium]
MRRTILITGATDGIGKQTAFRLAQMGHTVILHGHRQKSGKKLVALLQKETKNKNIHYVNADFTSFSEIEGMVETLLHKNTIPEILINNAGVYEEERLLVTDQLIEKTFMVNYLAHFYLSYLLVPIMAEYGTPHIINVSSMIHANKIDLKNIVHPEPYDATTAYGTSKLAAILFTKKLAREIPDARINAIHPGVVDTKLLRKGWGGGGSDANSGADQLLFAALEIDRNTTGKYFEYSNIAEPAAIANNNNIQEELWNLS